MELCDGNLRNIGGQFEARNSQMVNIGVKGVAMSPTDGSHYDSFGGVFEADDATNYNFGVWANSSANTGGPVGALNYGVYAYTPTGPCGPGGWLSCYQAAGFFNGDLFHMGALQASDIRLKDNVQPLENNISIIKQLNPRSYNFRTAQFPNHSLPQGYQSGLIAQEVYNVLPHLIKGFKVPALRDSTGHPIDTTGTSEAYMALNYEGLIPYLIGAIKEQQSSIDSIITALTAVQSQINNCCGATGNMQRKSVNVELADITEVILQQNSPNPFSEDTYINYSIPENVSKAMIIIYDNHGTVMKRVIIEDRGEGSVHVFAEKLSAGIYSYSLVADGKTIDTKQMVCTK